MTVVFVIVGLSVLILGHEWGHFFAAKKFGLKVDEFGFGFPPKIFAWRSRRKIKEGETLRQAQGETEYSLNWLPFGGFVKIAGENDRISGDSDKLQDLPPAEKRRIFLFQPAWKRAVIILAGIFVNLIIGWFLFSVVFLVGTPKALILTAVQPGSPAEAVGIKANDILEGYTDSDTFVNFVNANRGKEIEVSVLRGSEKLKFKVVPRVSVKPEEGALGVGIAPAGADPQGFFKSFWYGLEQTGLIAAGTVKGFYILLKGLVINGRLSSDVTGPVGIFTIASQIGKIGWAYLINLLALISVNLAVINLIPFPALDGGRFFLILIEKIKGSPVPVKLEAVINGVGFALLLALMVVITARDLIRLF